ncbi:hypothetical protein K402DRAFT_243997 [Aulographum hederae CBS 113979]|uniref:Calmodulin n=1 Tax=Aulographum hederae CBS 113979 TaxID=1176131 RepID=A0A6G1H9Q6_9PEZI|nr:hypothetical protein K402DRAFT_243997 [Aulographum hederae CBS 113979]
MPPHRTAKTLRHKASSALEQRPSKLAREHGLTAAQESEIREAFRLFAILHPDFEDEDEGVLQKADVRRCLRSLSIEVDSSDLPEMLDAVDPTGTGVVPFGPFLSLAALRLTDKDNDDDDDEEEVDYNDGTEEDEDLDAESNSDIYAAPPPTTKTKGKSKASTTTPSKKRKRKPSPPTDPAIIDEAFALFTGGASGRVYIEHLRRVMRELHEDYTDQELKDMILVANGEQLRGWEEGSQEGWEKGVSKEDFVGVMRRCGAF